MGTKFICKTRSCVSSTGCSVGCGMCQTFPLLCSCYLLRCFQRWLLQVICAIFVLHGYDIGVSIELIAFNMVWRSVVTALAFFLEGFILSVSPKGIFHGRVTFRAKKIMFHSLIDGSGVRSSLCFSAEARMSCLFVRSCWYGGFSFYRIIVRVRRCWRCKSIRGYWEGDVCEI